jgi:AhpD family alkylhydroperoxidase
MKSASFAGESFMARDNTERISELNEAARRFSEIAPDAAHAFSALSEAAQAKGALDRKTKELIALSISVAERCDGCIAYHARALVRVGAARPEVAEALAVTVQMGGGPSYYTAAEALRAFDEFAEAPSTHHRHGVE